MRKPRKLAEGARYHVIARANRQEFILESDRIKDMLLSVIGRARRRFRFSIDTLCIMDNHIHLLVLPGHGESLSRIMQWILSVFAIRFNCLFGLHGHVWYDRFKSVILGTMRQFVRAYQYIGDNPVRAGKVLKAGDYPYGIARLRDSGKNGALGPPGLVTRLLFPYDCETRLLTLRLCR
jgi:putative transposase